MKKILFYLLILGMVNICAAALSKYPFATKAAMAMALMEEKEDDTQAPEPEEPAAKPADKLTIEKDSNGVTIIRQNSTRQNNCPANNVKQP